MSNTITTIYFATSRSGNYSLVFGLKVLDLEYVGEYDNVYIYRLQECDLSVSSKESLTFNIFTDGLTKRTAIIPLDDTNINKHLCRDRFLTLIPESPYTVSARLNFSINDEVVTALIEFHLDKPLVIVDNV